jgi:hypothetical protein
MPEGEGKRKQKNAGKKADYEESHLISPCWSAVKRIRPISALDCVSVLLLSASRRDHLTKFSALEMK